MKDRIQWIDWMKVLAMYFVVWGHCFPELMSSFIYAFNVPVFFVISGFLTREQEDSNSFFPKFVKTLLIPYLLLGFIKGAGSIIKGLGTGEWYITIGAILGGFHTIDGIQGCSNLWFVYSLMIIRLIHHVIKGRRPVILLLVVTSIIAAWQLPMYFEMPKWAVTDALLAIPCFYFGHLMRTSWHGFFDLLCVNIRNSSNTLRCVAIVISAFLVYEIASFNGKADMYAGGFGANILVFYFGAIVGTLGVFLVSMALENVVYKGVAVIATGNIVILTFHRELLHTPLKMIKNSDMMPWMQDSASALLSVAVMLCFIPICWIVIRYLPILVGGRKISR